MPRLLPQADNPEVCVQQALASAECISLADWPDSHSPNAIAVAAGLLVGASAPTVACFAESSLEVHADRAVVATVCFGATSLCLVAVVD